MRYTIVRYVCDGRIDQLFFEKWLVLAKWQSPRLRVSCLSKLCGSCLSYLLVATSRRKVVQRFQHGRFGPYQRLVVIGTHRGSLHRGSKTGVLLVPIQWKKRSIVGDKNRSNRVYWITMESGSLGIYNPAMSDFGGTLRLATKLVYSHNISDGYYSPNRSCRRCVRWLLLCSCNAAKRTPSNCW